MTYNERIARDMIKTCLSFVDKNKSVCTGNKIIESLVSNLRSTVDKLDAAILLQQHGNSEGHVENKNIRLAEMGVEFYRLSRSLTLFAKINNNIILLNDVDITESAIIAGSEEAIITRCKSLAAHARANAEKLREYGFNPEDIQKLEAKLQEVQALSGALSVTSNEQKIATQNIKICLSESRKVLDMLDDAFEAMIHNQDFLNAWFEARKIKGRHRTKKDEDFGDDIAQQ